MEVISKLILIEMDKRMHDMTHKIHLAIQKDLDSLYYSGIENKIESRVRDEVDSRVTRVIPDIKTTILQSVQRQPEANPDVHQESREKKRRLNEEDQRNNKHLEEQLTKFSDTLQMVLNQNKEMQKRIDQLESELKKNQAREEVPDTKHVPLPMSANLNAKTVTHVEKQVEAMEIDKPTGTSQQASSKNRKKK